MSDQSPPAYAGPQRVFSGMQPTNGLHLGNYLGALTKFVALQQRFDDCIYCIVDLHAMTADHDPKTLAERSREVAAAYLAAGVDPKRSIVFVQSAVRAHAELAWIFNCVARMGWLERMTQFKDKAGKHSERMSVGLFDYPVLQAADILAYKATHVPVGEDQKQHLELARDIAQKFNNDFDAPGFFPLPESLIEGPGARIMSLRDGAKKMSKSDPSDMSRINLTDDSDAIMNKIKKATTDPQPLPETKAGLDGRPEVENLVGIYAAVTDKSVEAALQEWGGKGFGAFKPALAEALIAKLSPIAAELRRLLADRAALDAILREGAARADALAEPIMRDVRRIVGFWGA
ncbi:MAG: tryptophan--tRNA ligase [Hydrogenophilaceae bacterium]|jgi:tryptophanyl-tRNA synthetase|nr:tryptophan--tRNA ligase [Hydrogenophilaceae bacterium]